MKGLKNDGDVLKWYNVFFKKVAIDLVNSYHFFESHQYFRNEISIGEVKYLNETD